MSKEKVFEAVDFIKSNCTLVPSIGVVLGSGLGNFTSDLLIEKEISYKADYRINKLKGCYSEIKFRDVTDDNLTAIPDVEMIEKSKYDDILKQLNELKASMIQSTQAVKEPELTDLELEAMFEMCI